MKHESIAGAGDILKISRRWSAIVALQVLYCQSFAVVNCKDEIITDPAPVCGSVAGIFWAVHLSRTDLDFDDVSFIRKRFQLYQ